MEADASRYEILAELGRGGMGEVYLARDPRLGRQIALKFLSPAPGDARAARHLLREARASAALDHPFICKTYETGELDGRPFIAMEYVEGPTLKARLASGPLPLREALRLASEIADALDHAHRHGTVHRDLKPANVILTPEGHVKLLDFGVARQAPAAAAATADTVTASLVDWALCGTPAYMAPEQLAGAEGDEQSDLFAFGLLLHEMLTGRHPYLRPSPQATAAAILTAPVPPLGLRGAEGSVLSHVVERMLSKDRRTRFQSAREIRAELISLLEPPARPGRRVVSVLVAALLLLALAGLLLAAWLRMETPALAFKERDWVVIADFDNLTGEPAFDRPLQAALAVGIEQSHHVNVLPPARVRDGLRRMQRAPDARLDVDAASELAIREGVQVVLAGSIAQLGQAYRLTTRLVDPATRGAIATETTGAVRRDEVLSALDGLARRVRRRLGESMAGLRQQGRPLPLATTPSLDALNLLVESRRQADSQVQVRLLREALALDPEFALAHADLGVALYLGNQRAEGEAHLARALSLLARLTTREQLWIRAVADDSRGNREDAVEHFKVYLAQYPDDAGGWFRLGWTYMAALGEWDLGADAFRRVLEINPRDVSARINLATCLGGLRRDHEAVAAYEEAFAARPDLRTGIFVNHEYGFLLVQMGEARRAAEVFREMIATKAPALQARGHRSMGLLEMYRGRYAAAAGELGEAILLNRAHDATLSEFRDRLLRATALEASGRPREALEEIAAAQRIAETMVMAPIWLRALGSALAQRGRVAEAERLLARAEATLDDPTAASGVNRSARMEQVHVRLLRGEIALARGQTADALAEFELGHRLRSYAETFAALAAAHRARGDEAAESALLEQLIAAQDLGEEPQQAWLLAHLRLGWLHERAGRSADARRLYEALRTIWQDADEEASPVRELHAALARVTPGA